MTDPAGVVPSRPSVTLPPLSSPVDELWHVLLDLAEQLTVPWTIVGGQMVLLQALEHGRVPPQVSQDGDVLADVRSSTGAIRAVVTALETAGFHVDGSPSTTSRLRCPLPRSPQLLRVGRPPQDARVRRQVGTRSSDVRSVFLGPDGSFEAAASG